MPDYLDNRSDPAALVRSYYNAISRQEFARAYSYLADPPDYAGFASGYADTAGVALELGEVSTDGATGSIYGSVPIALEATSTSGDVTVFAGCYTTRQVQPAVQSPPFRPIQIANGDLKKIGTPGTHLADAVPANCPLDGN